MILHKESKEIMTAALLLDCISVYSLKSLCIQHSTSRIARNDPDVACNSKVTKSKNTTGYHLCFLGGNALLKFNGFVETQFGMVF